MSKILITVTVLAFSIMGGAVTVHAQSPYGNEVGFGTSENPGLYCKVEKAEVCVIAQSVEDCEKIGGAKVDSCDDAEKKD